MNVVQSTTEKASEGKSRKVVNAITIVAIRAAMYSHENNTRSVQLTKVMICCARFRLRAYAVQAMVETRGTAVMAMHEARQRTSSARDGDMYDHAMQWMAPKPIPRIDGPKAARMETTGPEIESSTPPDQNMGTLCSRERTRNWSCIPIMWTKTFLNIPTTPVPHSLQCRLL